MTLIITCDKIINLKNIQMRTLISLLILALLITHAVNASIYNDTVSVEKSIILHTVKGLIFGTLTTPATFTQGPVALIIAGSGPVDRDGNIPGIKINSYKLLSDELLKKGIATLRYDKRGVGTSIAAILGKGEEELRFDDYIDDAKGWVKLLKEDKRFSKVVVIGHSEGSLIGMPASTLADKYISLAGAGQSVDKVLRVQINQKPKSFSDLALPILDSLVMGKTVVKVDPMVNVLFRPSVQPYMISWIKYDPQNEISKIKIPVLILQGTNDLNLSVDNAKMLSSANPNASLVFIENMNHNLRIVGNDMQANMKTYSETTLPISDQLVKSITDFILKN